MNNKRLKTLKRTWDFLGRSDPLWAIMSQSDKKGNKWDIDEFFLIGVSDINAVFDHLQALNIRIPTGKALDFGCGVGRLTQALADHFEEVHGVDISPSMIDTALKYNRKGQKCQYHLNEANHLKIFIDNSFDFIYSGITLQHIPSRYSKVYIAEFLRILSPDGILVFDLPSEPRGIMVLKQLIVKVIGYSVLNACFQVVFARPLMEMHAIKKANVIQFLEQNKAKIIDIELTPSLHNTWVKFQYYVTKK